jgi:uncharacterized membrane protein YkvA (DUF1232 family)
VLRDLATAIVCGVALWLLVILALLLLGKRAAARELAALIPNLLVLFRGLLSDPRVPRSSKFWLWFAVIWLVSPVDLIPEFVPVVGPLDDAIVAALILRHVVKRTDRNILAQYWRGKPGTLNLIS